MATSSRVHLGGGVADEGGGQFHGGPDQLLDTHRGLCSAGNVVVGMGLAAPFVLICSNVVISLLKKVIPDKVRIPCYIVRRRTGRWSRRQGRQR